MRRSWDRWYSTAPERRRRTVEAPNGARVVFLSPSMTDMGLLDVQLKWAYLDAFAATIERERVLMDFLRAEHLAPATQPRIILGTYIGAVP